MPELRQNLATKEWVVIATERAVKPETLRQKAGAGGPEREPSCPFCPGNERQSEELYSVGEGKQWRVRVVRNKNAALIPNAPQPSANGKLYRRLAGEGLHEVIIESPSHAKTFSELSREQVEDIVAAYQERFRASASNMKIALTLIYRNQGRAAGTTLEHPHSQLIGSSVVPSHVRHRMDEAERYFTQNNECVICRMVEEEAAQKARVIADTKHYAAFVLFAALSPFHIWIVPKRHTASFGDITAAEANDLAGALQGVLKRLDAALGRPAYNYVIQSAPQDRGNVEPYHWYLSLAVRLGGPAGLEMGSGMHVNNVLPEEAARFLNAAKG